MTPEECRQHIELERTASKTEMEATDRMMQTEIKHSEAVIANLAVLRELGGSDPLTTLAQLATTLSENPTMEDAT